MGPFYGHATLCTAVVLLLLLCALASSDQPRGRFLFERQLLASTRSLKQHVSPPQVTGTPSAINKIFLPLTNSILPINSTTNSGTTLNLPVCLDCITFMQNNLESLVAIVAKIGVSDTCDKICGLLNNSLDVAVCEELCDAIGSEKFWQLFVSAGINPIYACEMVNACATGSSPAVVFTAATITPPTGPPGTAFVFNVQFTVINETGVGETAFVIYYPIADGYQLGFIAQQIFTDYTPGDYEVDLTFPTNSSFIAGKYLLIFDMCSGACGQDPSPYPFATAEYTFNISNPTLTLL